MQNNRIIQDAIDENSNADDATNKNHNRSINKHLYYKANCQPQNFTRTFF